MSRQRDYQKQMRFEGRCIICGDPATDSRRKGNANGKSPYCSSHLVTVRERKRGYAGNERRNLHAGSYKLEDQQDGTGTDSSGELDGFDG